MEGTNANNEVENEHDHSAQRGEEFDSSPDMTETDTTTQPPTPAKPTKSERKNLKPPLPAHGKFKKARGSNPQEVRRQFLAHQMITSTSPITATVTANTSAKSSTKLRTGREVLNRMKFDPKYNTEDYVVGYIDRKEGILEKSVEEWEVFGRGQEELMAYVRDVRVVGNGGNGVVWDRARRVDMVFGGERG